jgi:alanyl-tRNA synthetase
MWISMAGCAGDQYIPPFIDEIKEKYPDLIDKKINKVSDILFNSEFGKLARILSFCLKGNMDHVKKCIKIMTRIKSPYEILKQESSQGNFIYDKYLAVEKEYQQLLREAIKHKKEDNILIYIYEQDKMSLNQELSNELTHKFSDKVIVVGRRKSGELKLSFRASKYNLPPLIQKALEGCEGYGGGHEHAAGANVKEKDFEKFMQQFKAQLN